MSTTATSRQKNLVDLEGPGGQNGQNGQNGFGRYVAFEHELTPAAGEAEPPFRAHPADLRTFVVVDGVVDLDTVGPGGAFQTVRVGKYEGWHAAPGSIYRFRNTGSARAAVVEAGTARGQTVEATADELTPLSQLSHAGHNTCAPVSTYRVEKPWGYELWYTANLDDAPYAVKQIHMTAGHQSSLQSHRLKAETNYVVDGEATVLNGLPAPADLNALIEVDRIPVGVHGPGSGWTSAPGILHRVIARSDYTSIEVSTPELDDVIRWQDDTGRGHGRIAAEHGGPAGQAGQAEHTGQEGGTG